MGNSCQKIVENQDRFQQKNIIKMSSVVFLSREKLKKESIQKKLDNELAKFKSVNIGEQCSIETEIIQKTIQKNIEMIFEYLS